MKLTPSLGGAYSGSLGGVTASHNKGGSYFRRRSVPVSPNTARQQAVKAVVGGLVQAWSDELSDAQREAWRDYAANVPIQDTLGQTILLSGQNWYIAINTPILQALNSGLTGALGLSRKDAAPTTFNTGEAVSAVTDFEETGGALTLNANLAAPASAGAVALLFVGSPQNAGRRFFKGPYQLAAASSVIVETDTDLSFAVTDQTDPAEWATDKVLQAADRVPVRLIVAYDDGRVSQEFREITTVIAGV